MGKDNRWTSPGDQRARKCLEVIAPSVRAQGFIRIPPGVDLTEPWHPDGAGL